MMPTPAQVVSVVREAGDRGATAPEVAAALGCSAEDAGGVLAGCLLRKQVAHVPEANEFGRRLRDGRSVHVIA